MQQTTTKDIPCLKPIIRGHVLDALSLEFIDLQDETNESIPDGYPRYQVKRNGRYLCSISVWGDRYYTRAVNNLAGYKTLYEALTCWINPKKLRELEDAIEREIVAERDAMPNYF